MGIIEILQSIAAPLPPDIFLATLLSGLIFGALYHAKLNLPKVAIWHLLRAGINFILLLFVFRSLYVAFVGATISNPLGWIGIGILWLTYCLFIYVGQIVAERIQDYMLERKLKAQEKE